MGTLYSHLSDSDRLYIEVLHRHGASCAGIARFLGRHRSTVCREFSRAKSFGVPSYFAHFGQRYYSASRRRAGLARRKLGPNRDSPAWQLYALAWPFTALRRRSPAGCAPPVSSRAAICSFLPT